MRFENLFHPSVRPFISQIPLEFILQNHPCHTDRLEKCFVVAPAGIPGRIKVSDQRRQFILLTGIIVVI